MSHRNPLDDWTQTLATHFPHLSKPQVAVLTLWSFGMVLAHSCGLTADATALVPVLNSPLNTLRGPKSGRNEYLAGSSSPFEPDLSNHRWCCHERHAVRPPCG